MVGRPLEKIKVEAKDLDDWCRLLSSADGRAAYRAVWKLAAAGDDAVAALKGQLRLPRTEASQIARWIAELDDDNFATREKASLELLKVGEEAERPLELALKSPRSREQKLRLEKIYAELSRGSVTRLHQIRSIMVLEQIASPSARQGLAWLANEASDAFLRRQAHLALKRLDNE